MVFLRVSSLSRSTSRVVASLKRSMATEAPRPVSTPPPPPGSPINKFQFSIIGLGIGLLAFLFSLPKNDRDGGLSEMIAKNREMQQLELQQQRQLQQAEYEAAKAAKGGSQ